MSNEMIVSNQNTPATLYSDDGFNIQADMTTAKSQYCSMVANTSEEKANLFNAMNNPDERLADCINKTISVKHVYVEIVTCTNQETGEMSTCPRIVLIDDKNRSYQCVSIGIYSALKKIFQVFGAPEVWEQPVKVAVKQISKGTRKMLTLNVVAG